MTNFGSVLEEAARLVNHERQNSYGHPGTNLSRTACMWAVIFGVPVSIRMVVLAMIAHKLAREVHAHKRDNLVDVCGYVRCLERAEAAGYDVDYKYAVFSSWKKAAPPVLETSEA